jgi:hypothetical protein
MVRQPTLDPRETARPRAATYSLQSPVTAIPARFVGERERVLQIMERWSATLQASRSFPVPAR